MHKEPTMLCRTASDLFWIGRASERAEAMARLLDLARRLAALPATHGGEGANKVWSLPLLATGAIPPGVIGTELSTAAILARCVLDADNPSSVLTCVQLARDAARNQRSVVPNEVVTTLQLLLDKLRAVKTRQLANGQLGPLIADIRGGVDMFRGVAFATMMRTEPWHFMRLGTFLERADGAIRLWTTQADPEFALLRDGPDSPHAAFHRVALLEAASALMPLRRLHGEPDPNGVTEMLLRRSDFPRSAAYSLVEAQKTLGSLQVSPSEALARQLGRAHAGVAYQNPRPESAAMFVFGAARLAEIARAQDEVEQRFFIARVPARRAA